MPPAKPRPPIQDRAGRAAKVKAALAAREGVTAHQTSKGTVNLGALTFHDATADTPAIVDVHMTDSADGEPAYRIENAGGCLYVPDPNGDVVIDGVTCREDPVAAIAEVLATFTAPATRRRR